MLMVMVKLSILTLNPKIRKLMIFSNGTTSFSLVLDRINSSPMVINIIDTRYFRLKTRYLATNEPIDNPNRGIKK